MKLYEATETAYKNGYKKGYEDGRADATKNAVVANADMREHLFRLLIDVAYMSYDRGIDYLISNGIRLEAPNTKP